MQLQPGSGHQQQQLAAGRRVAPPPLAQLPALARRRSFLASEGSRRRDVQLLQASTAKPNASFDADDLDTDLAAELRAVADPKRTERMRSHYELLWKATRARGQVQTCTCCAGTGEKECDWCHGTGFLTVGDKVFTGLNKNECPVCKAKGYVKCDFCRGTGSRAQWIPPLFDSSKQQQERGGSTSS